MRITVRFPRGNREYTYSAPDGVEVGDVVVVPANWYHARPQLVQVTGIPRAGRGYLGPTSRVLNVFKDVTKELESGSGPDYEVVVDALIEKTQDFMRQLEFVRERI